ncbi:MULTISPECIES: hypothetical protein [Burkholderiaceae]|uniref:hypothetical protein n=1 Tax=Burkholderiaceae TaxID=119060 RepID=UPI00095DFC84|nr:MULTISPECIES: hypothetical protein [Burkholderiaceae]MCF2134468.1 hypothetical protein [Mycetohabitans sp. B3]MCG1039918.1 hypothetical protein [Mycetohabitans sp. B7]SIT71634.1 hypothetical protein SAMN04487769_1911 [Burkholderia sp. b14]SIT73318.1 hypothetical protein SAMN04487768_2761 [Burkholderia sp. b13]
MVTLLGTVRETLIEAKVRQALAVLRVCLHPLLSVVPGASVWQPPQGAIAIEIPSDVF